MKFEQTQNKNVILLHKWLTRDPLPEVGKTYIVYDDGKVRFERMEFVTVTKIVDLDKEEISEEDMQKIKDEINDCSWLYDSEQHKIFYATNGEDNYIFLMTYGRYWFSLGWLVAGRLDINGSLTRELFKMYKDNNVLDKIKSEEYFITHKDILEKYL